MAIEYHIIADARRLFMDFKYHTAVDARMLFMANE